jgi:Aspartyl protease
VAYEIVYHHRLAYDVSDGGIALPVIIAANGLTEAVTAAIDTGSTLCVFQREVAESLGVTVEDGIEDYVSAMGTIIRVYGHEATLTVGDLALDLFVYFPDYQNIPRNLLGRQGFLQRLRFGLDDYKGIVYLSRHDDP